MVPSTDGAVRKLRRYGRPAMPDDPVPDEPTAEPSSDASGDPAPAADAVAGGDHGAGPTTPLSDDEIRDSPARGPRHRRLRGALPVPQQQPSPDARLPLLRDRRDLRGALGPRER